MDREGDRERMLKMFVEVGADYKNNFITASTFSLPIAQSDSDFDRAEIVVRVDSKKDSQLSDADFNLTKTAKGKLVAGSSESSLIDLNLTKKQSNTLKKSDVKNVAR